LQHSCQLLVAFQINSLLAIEPIGSTRTVQLLAAWDDRGATSATRLTQMRIAIGNFRAGV
jgi:hypothetical protein